MARPLPRRRFLRLTAAGAAAALAGCSTQRPAPTAGPDLPGGRAERRKPNILVIVSDDQGYADLGCYGGQEIQTPHLDALAAEGVKLTSFYVAWPACTPSRGSLLTGRYPQRNGTYDMFRNNEVDFDKKLSPAEYAVSPERILGMDTREVLLPRMLKPAGYRCGIFGKWDLGQLRRFLPRQRGFDDFYGFVNTGIDYWTHERYTVPSMVRDNRPTTEDRGTYCTDLFTREAIRFVRANRHQNQPTLCYVPYNAPHMASTLDRPRVGAQVPLDYLRKRYGSYDETKPHSRRSRRLRFMGSISYMDDCIGRIVAEYKTLGLWDHTIVIFFSDNGGGGGSDNRPLRGGKGKMFEGGLRVPCIVRWPGVTKPGSESGEFLTALEILPTLCAAAGVPPTKGVPLDGFDCRDVLAGKTPSPRKEMFWQRRGDRAARVGRWKWVQSVKGSGLFDLQTDLSEKTDLSKAKPDILKQVQARFAAWKQQMAAAEPRRPFRDF